MIARRDFHGFRAVCILFALLLLAGSGVAARAQVPKPGVGTSVTPPQKAAISQRQWLPIFQFHSGFWLNLNLYLYLQARLELGLSPKQTMHRPAAWMPADLTALSESERGTWQAAVSYYATNFAGSDLPYDSAFNRINDRLSEMNSCPDLSGRSSMNCQAGLAPELTRILESAAPVYRAHWWPSQDHVNQAWITLVSAQVRGYAAQPAQLLARAYESTWPADPIHVDVTPYAGPFGSYATFDPFHVVLASGDPINQGASALGVVLYQSSYSLATEAQQEIVDACRNQTKPIPRDLWHALVYYTVAEILQKSLTARGPSAASAGDVAPTPPAARQYMAARDWESYQPLLERYWQPYLDNRTDMSSAIERLINAL